MAGISMRSRVAEIIPVPMPVIRRIGRIHKSERALKKMSKTRNWPRLCAIAPAMLSRK